jgi:hypothetical protein
MAESSAWISDASCLSQVIIASSVAMLLKATK